jgi:hypothetical protein
VLRKKREPDVCVEARALGHFVPEGMSIMELATRVYKLTWVHPPPGATKQEQQRIYAKNRRKIQSIVRSEKAMNARDGEIKEAGRTALETEARRLDFEESVIESSTLEGLQQLIWSMQRVGGSVSQWTPADLVLLGDMPLGSAMKLSGGNHRLLSPVERAQVLDARNARSRLIFKQFLDSQDEIEWRLCSNCFERKLSAIAYKQ